MKERGDLTGPPAGYDGHEIEIVAWDGWRLRSEDVRLTVSRDILAVPCCFSLAEDRSGKNPCFYLDHRMQLISNRRRGQIMLPPTGIIFKTTGLVGPRSNKAKLCFIRACLAK